MCNPMLNCCSCIFFFFLEDTLWQYLEPNHFKCLPASTLHYCLSCGIKPGIQNPHPTSCPNIIHCWGERRHCLTEVDSDSRNVNSIFIRQQLHYQLPTSFCWNRRTKWGFSFSPPVHFIYMKMLERQNMCQACDGFQEKALLCVWFAAIKIWWFRSGIYIY